MYKKSIIFLTALLARCVLGFIFYGSIDVTAFIGIHGHTVHDTLKLHPFLIWCAFPVFPFYLWLCGLLAISTALPLAFCFKTIPILFDSLLACLLYDSVQKIRPNHAFATGMLYALSPVALLITCIHGQWDALPILFLVLGFYIREFFHESYQNYFWFGMLFAFSILLKPIALVLSPFFFKPFKTIKQELGRFYNYLIAAICMFVITGLVCFGALKINKTLTLSSLAIPLLLLGFVIALCLIYTIIRLKPWRAFSEKFITYLQYQATAVLGVCSMFTLCFICFSWYGLNVLTVIDKVLRYFNQGIHVFGLPYAWPCNQGLLALMLKNRLWIMAIIIYLATRYYQEKIDIFNALVAVFAIIFTFSGLCPQYTLWLVPLLLIAGMYRLSAVYTLLLTAFFIMYYMNPLSNQFVPYQSMLSFAALNNFSWCTPPDFLTHEKMLPVMKLLGNYLFPLLCAVIACGALRKKLLVQYTPKQYFSWVKNYYIIFWAILTAAIAGLMLILDQTTFAQRYDAVVACKLDVYHVEITQAYAMGVCDNSVWWCNIASMLVLLACVWGFYAGFSLKNRKQS